MLKLLALQQTYKNLQFICQQILSTNHKWIITGLYHFDKRFLQFDLENQNHSDSINSIVESKYFPLDIYSYLIALILIFSHCLR